MSMVVHGVQDSAHILKAGKGLCGASRHRQHCCHDCTEM